METNKKWSSDFYRLVEDFEYNCIDEDQFRAKLIALYFPHGYVEWLIYKMTRPET